MTPRVTSRSSGSASHPDALAEGSNEQWSRPDVASPKSRPPYIEPLEIWLDFLRSTPRAQAQRPCLCSVFPRREPTECIKNADSSLTWTCPTYSIWISCSLEPKTQQAEFSAGSGPNRDSQRDSHSSGSMGSILYSGRIL